jgi:hypothetical protein
MCDGIMSEVGMIWVMSDGERIFDVLSPFVTVCLHSHSP